MRNYARLLSVVVLITIVFYGFFKTLVCRIYAIPVGGMLELFGYDPNDVLQKFNDFQGNGGRKFSDHLLGWLIYYPSYLLLHLVFIQLLFWKDKLLRNQVSVGLISVIALLLAFIGVGKAFDFQLLYGLSYKLFQKLFGLPFILLSIEGGRLLFMDIDKKLSPEKKDD